MSLRRLYVPSMVGARTSTSTGARAPATGVGGTGWKNSTSSSGMLERALFLILLWISHMVSSRSCRAMVRFMTTMASLGSGTS